MTPDQPGARGLGQPDPLEAITADPDAAAILRRNLDTIAETHRNTPLGNLVSDVLAGRRSPHALEHDPAFMTLARAGVQTYRDHLAALTPDERDALTRQAQALADTERR